jgi:formylglycine-generating enzyme required for sulfatase activity
MRRIFTGVLLVATALLFGGCSIGGGDTPPSMDYSSPTIGTLKYVPAGTFQRDSDPGNTSTVSAFRMSEYEIDRVQFYAIMGKDPSDMTKSSGIYDPVQMANWYHAIAFCNKLSIAEGLTPVYSVSVVADWEALAYTNIPVSSNTTWNGAAADWDADGYRLPTEMEWMWAAMGADTADPGAINTTGYSKVFAGSTGTNDIDDHAWYFDFVITTTQPSGGKSANELNLYDMSGNVFEWCWDWYEDPYPTGAVSDYRGAASGDQRIYRGGSFELQALCCAVGYRGANKPELQNVGNGFRVVRP